MLSLYHNYILSKNLSVPPTDDNNAMRYANHNLSAPLYRKIALLLSTVQGVEVLAEMAFLKKHGRKRTWDFLVYIEGLK
jgi:hypothetical protein